MKKILTITLACMLMLSTQTFGQGFTITGTIKGVKEGKVTIQARGGDKYATGLQDGKFTLKGKVTSPSLHTMRVEGARGTTQIFVDNSEMTLVGDSENMREAKVTGSATHDVYANYMALLKEISLESRPLNEAYSEARKAKNESEMKRLTVERDKANADRTRRIEVFISENNKSVASAYILASMASRYKDPAKLEAAINSLDSSLDNNNYVVSTKKVLVIAKKTAVGQTAMDFAQNDPDGNPIHLSDYRGKVVLVDFWAAWCGPCRGENPNVVAAFNKYKSKGFTVLGVSLDKDKEKWLEAIEKDGLTWKHCSDLQYWDNAVSAMYGVRSIPANILVGKDGKILAKNLRGEALHEKLAELL